MPYELIISSEFHDPDSGESGSERMPIYFRDRKKAEEMASAQPSIRRCIIRETKRTDVRFEDDSQS